MAGEVYTFEPPTVLDNPTVLPTTRGPAYDLFKWYGTRARGRSVLKNAGIYTVLDMPTTDQVNSADIAYLGGHIYEVTVDEANALIAAGFTVTIGTPITGTCITTELEESLLTEDLALLVTE
jgi:hypothetical protein